MTARDYVGLDLIGGTHNQCSNGGTDRGTKQHPSIRSVGDRMWILVLLLMNAVGRHLKFAYS